MKLQAKAGSQFAALDDADAGEGLAIFFSQSATDNTRWRLEVSVRLDNGADKLIGFFYVSPPNATIIPGPLTRQVAFAVCPGAKSWSVVARPSGGPIAAAQESADIELSSSECCTGPAGLWRTGERYQYTAGTASQVETLLPGQTVTRINAVGHAGGGAFAVAGLPSVAVAAGVSVALEPKAPIQEAGITFAAVDYVIEYLESA